jgi:hypothetical protein
MTRIWTGTVTVENANAIVAVAVGDPLSDANAPADGSVMLDGLGYFIKQRLSNSSFELTRPYAGADATVVCEIDPLTVKAISLFNVSRDITAYNARLALLEADGKGLFYTLRGPTGAADPGAGKLARNEDDWADVTELYIDVIDAANMLATPLIDAWDDGTILTVRSIATRAFAAYKLAGAPTDEGPGAWRRLASLTFLGGDDLLADDEDVAIEWNRRGPFGPGLDFDEAGLFAGRAAYNNAAKNFAYLSVNGDGAAISTAVVFVKLSAASADWSAALPIQGPIGRPGAGMMVAVTDESRIVEAGSAKITFRAPNAMTLIGIRASLRSASSSGPVVVDVNVAGLSILSTKLSLDAGERTSVTAAIPAVISAPAVPDDAEITIDIDSAGAGAVGLKVTFIAAQN